MKFRNYIFILFFFCFIFFSACGINEAGGEGQNTIKSGSYLSRTGFYFDTVVSVSIYSNADEKLLDNCMELCARYENIFSATSKNSEVYLINNLFSKPEKVGINHEISSDLYNVLKFALPYCEITEGKYDITIRPVSELWNFNTEAAVLPDKSEIVENLEKVDYRYISITADAGPGLKRYYISTSKAGVRLDLGSVAKGYIADCLDEYLRSQGVTSAVISLGGNIQCIGEKLLDDGSTEPFNIGIRSPFGANDEIYKTVHGSDDSIVTSGVYQRCFTYEGKLYHHILDARTGYPVSTGLASVTVVSDSGMKADLLSTVCFLLGYEESEKLFKEIENTYAEFVYEDGSIKTLN